MSLATTDTSCEAAARILGAGSWTVFRRVTLPIIQPGVIAGGVIAFIVSFDEAVISLFVAESGLPTLPCRCCATWRIPRMPPSLPCPSS